MPSRTTGRDDERTRRREGRALAGGDGQVTVSASDSPSASQREDRLAMRPLKLLRFRDVRERTGLSRSTVWRLERRGAFPKHIRVSANIVAWLEEDIVEWIRSKAKGPVV